jgi:hypothetical protein
MIGARYGKWGGLRTVLVAKTGLVVIFVVALMTGEVWTVIAHRS